MAHREEGVGGREQEETGGGRGRGRGDRRWSIQVNDRDMCGGSADVQQILADITKRRHHVDPRLEHMPHHLGFLHLFLLLVLVLLARRDIRLHFFLVLAPGGGCCCLRG